MKSLFTSRASTDVLPTVQLSERDKLAAEVEYETSLLPEFSLLVKMGRRDQKDLDAKQQYVSQLEAQLEAFDATEIAKVALDAKVRELMPARVEAMRDQLKDYHALLKQVTQAQDDLQRTAEQFQEDFTGANLNPVWGLLQQCHALRKVLSSDSYTDVSAWLARARHVIFGVPELTLRTDPKDLMTPAEKQKLSDDQRAKWRDQARRNGGS